MINAREQLFLSDGLSLQSIINFCEDVLDSLVECRELFYARYLLISGACL